MRMRPAVILLAVIALIGSSCSSSDGDGGSKEKAPQGWTILQYQVADNNLEPFLMADLDEMGAVGSNENVTIQALVDRSADYGDLPVLGLDAWVGAKVVRVDEDGAEVLDDLGDINTGDPVVLRSFLAAGIEDNPAEHYALVISDHGASWPGAGVTKERTTIC